MKAIFYVLLGIVALLFLYKCPFAYFFGICCPGCGMTRAFLSLVQFDIIGAFYYHPLFPVVILIFIYLILEHFQILSFSDRVKRNLLIIIAILFLITYLIRLFNHSSVVYIYFENAAFYRLWEHLKSISSLS